MAGNADGSIIVDTELNSEGFRSGSEELQRAVRSLTSKVNNLGPTFQKAMSGSESAAASLQARTAALEDTIVELEEKMNKLGDTPVETDEYQALCSELTAAESKFESLVDKAERFRNTGGDQNSSQYAKLCYDVDAALAKLQELETKKASLEQTGQSHVSGADTAEYQRMAIALGEAKDKLAGMRQEAESTGKASQSMVSKVIAGLRSALSHTKNLFPAIKHTASHSAV